MVTRAVTMFEQVPAVTINEYVPFAAICTLAMFGFWKVLENPLGPLQLYVAPPEPVNDKVDPTQFGEVLTMLGCGKLITVTWATALLVQPCALVTITVYPPLMFNCAFGITGF